MPSSASNLRILYAEGDLEVLSAQAVILEKAGHQVTQVLGRKPVEEIVKRETFDFVVLGPTLSKNDRHHLPYMVKKANQSTRVLVMHTDGERHPAVDTNLETGCRIESVLEKISAMRGLATAATAR
jgi:DNA-binding NtrC family response regulator